jgi:hypothetical protein
MELVLAVAGPPNASLEAVRIILDAAGLTTLAGGVIWITWIIRAVRRDVSRHRHGQCLNCGYDLRSCQDRCSECGAKIRLPHHLSASPGSPREGQGENNSVGR